MQNKPFDEQSKSKHHALYAPTGPPVPFNNNFLRFFKFGLVDASLVILGSVAGFSLESRISKLIGVKGYGILVGAGIGNTVADAIAGIPEGKEASVGVALGTLVPLIPIGLFMATKRPMDSFARTSIGITCITLCATAFLYKPLREKFGFTSKHL